MFRLLSQLLLLLVGLMFFCYRSGAFQQTDADKTAGSPDTAAGGNQASNSSDSNQGFVIEQIKTDVVFAPDGTGSEERSTRVRIESDAAVQQFGVLTFAYRNAFERIDLIDIRVKKPDGTVVSTPESDIQDTPTDVTRVAPAYSDAREKQVPVKGLEAGDILEWRIRTTRVTADVPGQFWYTYDFLHTSIVLEETLQITVPAGKYVKVSSPKLTPAVREENNHVSYSWKSSQRDLPKEETAHKEPEQRPRPAVQVTSFRSWEEVGRWYGGLQKPKAAVTPAIQAKAAELTRGLTTTLEKQHAIYQFVAAKFRYVSISFGQGRYQPHSADEVLTNQYGDCKDKHTLLSALLNAAGIDAWPALIGSGIEFDPDVPSPAEFNHVITYVPGSPSAIWLDTTPEVAPFGMLQFVLRDQKALVIPDNGVPIVMTTPNALPFRADESVDVKSQLSPAGTLTAQFDVSIRGDDEILMKSIFHSAPLAQWTQMSQKMANAMGFPGTVTGVSVSNPADTELPFHYSYKYEQKNYGDWENRRITPPLPPFGFEGAADGERPSDATVLGAPGTLTYRARIQLPEGYSVGIPSDLKLETAFAEYRSSYSVDKGALSVERVFVRKKEKVAVNEWEEYRKLAKAVASDETQFIELTRAGGNIQVTRDNAEAAEFVQTAVQSIQKREFSAARDALAQAERLNAQQPGLWAAYGFLYGMQNDVNKAVDALEKELQYHPGTLGIYQPLAAAQKQLGRNDEAIQTLRQWVAAAPENVDATLALTSELTASKRYGEALDPLTDAAKSNPDNLKVETRLLEVQLRDGKKTEALGVLSKLRDKKLDTDTQNSIAYVLADTSTETVFAQDLAQKAVTALEEQSKDLTLSKLTIDDLRGVMSLGATWDTLGWAYFRNGDLTKAEKFLQAGWLLMQVADSADHLGQLYERQGKKAEAIHAYRLALAAQGDLPAVRERLEKLGVKVDETPTLRRGRPGTLPSISAADELSQMRSVPVPGFSQRDGTAEFFVLLSSKGAEEARFISGDEKLKPAINALLKTSYKFTFPDDGPAKIARRGILSCSPYTTPSCNFVLLLPANTRP